MNNTIKSILIKEPFNFRSIYNYELISYFMMFASVPMLAYGIKEYNLLTIKTIILLIVLFYSSYFAALLWNDINDVEIDRIVHPKRALPSGIIEKKKLFTIALFFSGITFTCSLLISFWCFLLVGCFALFVTVHNKYLKKMIKFPAYSEIMTPLQWIGVPVIGFFSIWTSFSANHGIILENPYFGYISFNGYDIWNMIILIIFTYFVDKAHDISEGIHDVNGDLKFGVSTYSTSFGEKYASIIAFIIFFLSGIIGILLYISTFLSLLFLFPFLFFWLYTLYWYYHLINMKDGGRKEIAGKVGQKGFDFLLITYNLIFLDVLIQLINPINWVYS